jgi:hypothetical protein
MKFEPVTKKQVVALVKSIGYGALEKEIEND